MGTTTTTTTKVFVALCLCLMVGSCLGQLSVERRLSYSAQQCRINRITSNEPSRRIECEGGLIEVWDENDEQFQCSGIDARRITIQPNSLSLPSFHPFPRLVYIQQVQGEDLLSQLSLLPGFRFCPTDEELLVEYLCKKVAGHSFPIQIIAETDLYQYDPWVLPAKALFGGKEWYFFTSIERMCPNGLRPNRKAGSGFWKATGNDKIITTQQGMRVGKKKSLVFCVGKFPEITKTNWFMHEYRLTEPTRKIGSPKLGDCVLCRIYKKSSSAARTTENCTGGSSSSSHLDDFMESLLEPNWDLLAGVGCSDGDGVEAGMLDLSGDFVSPPV